MKAVWIAGCGYTGTRLALRLRDAGSDVHCMVRSGKRAEELRQQGFGCVTVDLDDKEHVHLNIPDNAVIFYAIPPQGGGTTDERARTFCQILSPGAKPSKIIYLGATSVYSERSGGVVDEQSPTIPHTAMGKRRLDAEVTFQNYGREHGVAVTILRVSAIYGPCRLPITQVLQKQPLLALEQSGPGNRIHVDDLVSACCAAMDRGQDGEIFNVGDGQHCSMTEYFDAVADAMGVDRQPQITADQARQVLSPLMYAYASETRRVSNRAMLDRLGITLRYENMYAGIRAALKETGYVHC